MYAMSENEKKTIEASSTLMSKDDAFFSKAVKDLSDRELQEKQAHYLWKMDKNTNRIKNNVVFFYYTFVVITVISLVILASK